MAAITPITVVIGNNVTRKSVPTTTNVTIRELLEANGVDYTRAQMHLDGVPLQAGDFDKTFGEFGISTKAFLTSVVKADCA